MDDRDLKREQQRAQLEGQARDRGILERIRKEVPPQIEKIKAHLTARGFRVGRHWLDERESGENNVYVVIEVESGTAPADEAARRSYNASMDGDCWRFRWPCGGEPYLPPI